MTPPPTPAAVARAVSGVLARFGFRVTVHTLPPAERTADGPAVVVTAARPAPAPLLPPTPPAEDQP